MRRVSLGVFVACALALAVGLATAVSPFTSSSPDGLERVADEQRFLDEGELGPLQERSPIPDYAFPGVEDERVATGLAGFAGTLGVFAVGWALAMVLRRLRRPREPRGATGRA